MSEISAIQTCPYSSINFAKGVSFQSNLREHFLHEEILWKQKSRELWLTCTDLNTKFFHASTACRKRYNFISCLLSANGSHILGRDNIGSHLVDHFSSLFSYKNTSLNYGIFDLVDCVIFDAENDNLCTIPGESEIFSAITDLGLNKAHGPDGMKWLFYKTYWPIVKSSVINLVQSLFREGFMLKEFNHTNIAIIFKIDNPSSVLHFRPISLINFNYKIISKILSNRFKPLIHKIISPTQSVFLKGRSIHDNTILAHEVFHTMKLKKKKKKKRKEKKRKEKRNGGLMALKLDMEKAFDL
jgi:hypothetical protein